MSMTISARAPVETLVYQLSSVEWGALDAACFRGARAILQALARAMTVRKQSLKAETDMTAEQLARQSGYGLRWTRNALHDLEDAGVIKWQRGGIRDGKPEAGIIRIVKSVLARWIRDALPTATRRERKRRERTARRLEKIHVQNLYPRLCRSAHEAVSADQPPYRGDTRRPRKGGAPKKLPPRKENMNMRKYEALAKQYLPTYCLHGIGRPIVCPKCRDIAMSIDREITQGIDRQMTLNLQEPAPSKPEGPTPEQLYESYMHDHYPELTPRHWLDVEAQDEQARRLASAAFNRQ